MRRSKRPYKNVQTAAVAAAVMEKIGEAIEFRNGMTSVEGFDGNFAGSGQAFSKTLNCRCAKAEGIDWKEIDELIQYDVASISKKVDVEIAEVEAVKVIEDEELPNKTLEVADKVEETILDGTDEDIDEQVAAYIGGGEDFAKKADSIVEVTNDEINNFIIKNPDTEEVTEEVTEETKEQEDSGVDNTTNLELEQ